MSELESTTKGSTEKGFFRKLADGDFGLAKTYWLYGILVSAVVSSTANAVTSIGGAAMLILAHGAYQIPLLMGIWRAANKYQGSQIWAILAKIWVVLGVIVWAGVLLVTIELLNQA